METAIETRQVPSADESIERVRRARRKLRHVTEMLLTPSPELLEGCGPALEEAAALLGSLLEDRTGTVPGPVPAMHDELQGLRRDLTVMTALMEQAAGYYLGWAQMLGAAVGGYTSQGNVPPLAVDSRVSVEG